MNTIILAALLTLQNGFNNVGTAGEVIAIEAATASASATVEVKAIQSFTEYTNATAEVVSYETAYHVQLPYTVEGIAETNEFFDFGLDGVKYMWTSKEAFPFFSNTKDVGNSRFAQVHENYVFAPKDTQGLNIHSGAMPGKMATITLPDTTAIDVYTVPTAQIIDGKEGQLYWSMLNGTNYVEEIVLPAGTVIKSHVAINPETGDLATRIASFDYTYPTTTNVVGYVDWDAFNDTNGVQRIIGEPVRFDMPITNTVVTAQVAAETYTATNDLATVNVTDHFGTVVTNGVIFGGGLLVTGAAEGDTVKILIK